MAFIPVTPITLASARLLPLLRHKKMLADFIKMGIQICRSILWSTFLLLPPVTLSQYTQVDPQKAFWFQLLWLTNTCMLSFSSVLAEKGLRHTGRSRLCHADRLWRRQVPAATSAQLVRTNFKVSPSKLRCGAVRLENTRNEGFVCSSFVLFHAFFPEIVPEERRHLCPGSSVSSCSFWWEYWDSSRWSSSWRNSDAPRPAQTQT